jgi:hypothetical protein
VDVQLSVALRTRRRLALSLLVLLSFSLAGITFSARFLSAQTAVGAAAIEPGFDQYVKPFFKQNCLVYWHRLSRIAHRNAIRDTGRRSEDTFFRDEKWLLADLSDFITRFYFGEVSNQTQALELFRWWSEHVGTPDLYRAVIEQAKFLREVQLNQW